MYVYFDNDAEGHAPHDALRLAARLGVEPVTEEEGVGSSGETRN